MQRTISSLRVTIISQELLKCLPWENAVYVGIVIDFELVFCLNAAHSYLLFTAEPQCMIFLVLEAAHVASCCLASYWFIQLKHS